MHPLTDAFWKGRSKLKKQTGGFFDDPKKPKKACAVGAMYFGLYQEAGIRVGARIANDYPEARYLVPVPCEHVSIDSVGSIIGILIHLNDAHDGRSWSDAKIAEWLESTLKGDKFEIT